MVPLIDPDDMASSRRRRGVFQSALGGGHRPTAASGRQTMTGANGQQLSLSKAEPHRILLPLRGAKRRGSLTPH